MFFNKSWNQKVIYAILSFLCKFLVDMEMNKDRTSEKKEKDLLLIKFSLSKDQLIKEQFVVAK